LKHANKPNLLILTSSFPRNGSDDTCGYIREFARSLSEDYSVTVLAPPDCGTDDRKEEDLTIIRSWSLVPSRWEQFRGTADLNAVIGGPILSRLSLGLSLICYAAHAVLLARSAALICCHWMAPSGVIGLFCGLLLGRPFIIVEHSGALHMLRAIRSGSRIARLLVLRSKKIYVVSADLRQKLASMVDGADGKVEVIPMGVDYGSYSPACGERGLVSGNGMGAAGESDASPAARLKVLFIGRLTEIKGAGLLIRASSEMAGIELTIAGDGELRNSLAALAKELGVPARLTGQADRAEKRRLLGECDAVVIPSLLLKSERAEGLPVVLLEAMAAAKPIIASRSGGLTDVIIDGENGLLFEPGDEKDLACKLRDLLAEPGMRSRLGAGAAISASRYDWSVIGEKFRSSIGGVL
jgi:glycosyltransferase involved in cell wall biosynthesis